MRNVSKCTCIILTVWSVIRRGRRNPIVCAPDFMLHRLSDGRGSVKVIDLILFPRFCTTSVHHLPGDVSDDSESVRLC